MFREKASTGDFSGIPDVVLQHLDEAQAAKRAKERKKKGHAEQHLAPKVILFCVTMRPNVEP